MKIYPNTIPTNQAELLPFVKLYKREIIDAVGKNWKLKKNSDSFINYNYWDNSKPVFYTWLSFRLKWIILSSENNYGTSLLLNMVEAGGYGAEYFIIIKNVKIYYEFR